MNPSPHATDGYLAGSGGFAVGPDGSSGDVLGEAGVRIAPGLFVFGDVGQLHNPSDPRPSIGGRVPKVLSDGDGASAIGERAEANQALSGI